MGKRDWDSRTQELVKNHQVRASGTKNRLEVIPIDKIVANPDQPRKLFDMYEIIQLAGTIKQHGLLQPIVVEESFDENRDETYTLISGERRFRASKIAGLTDIQAIIIHASNESDNATLALIENTQRKDLTPLEESEAMHKILKKKDISIRALAELCGKSYPHTRTLLKLSSLTEEIKEIVRSGQDNTSLQVLERLAAIEDAELMNKLYEKIKAKNLNKQGGLIYISNYFDGLRDELIAAAAEKPIKPSKPSWGNITHSNNKVILEINTKKISEEKTQRILEFIEKISKEK